MKYLTIALVLGSMLLTGTAFAQDALDAWPPRDYLVESLLDDIPAILATYHPETGRFGSEPWICRDQNHIFPLAAAWALEHPDNSYYHSDEVLEVIAGGGVALVEAQDEAGRWRFDKKDGSYWGQIHMPWTYSRWIRAYDLVGDALPEEARETWERGLLLGFGQIAKSYPQSSVHNIPVHRAMALYIAGECFDNQQWMDDAREFMAKAVDEQDPVGFWSENFGPVIGYNFVYSDSMGIYYAYSQDPVVLEALRRAAHFHSATLWPDGSAVPCIDERQLYSRSIRVGNPGFAHTPEGRGYLMAQMRRHAGEEGRLIAGDMAAALLLYGSDGEVVMPGEMADEGVITLGDNDALIRRGDALFEDRADDWSWAFSAYATDPPRSRWIQDRHNLVDVFHADLGLVAGGGNTKLQPYWSTFTLGDPSLLSHTGETHPNFTPEIDLVWTPDEATVSREGDVTRLEATLAPQSPPIREVLLTQGFEDTAEGALPEDWTVSYGSEAQMSAVSDEAHEGARAMHIIDEDEVQSVGLRSPKLPAQPGERFFAEAWWLGDEDNNGAVYLEFWDENDRIDGGVKAYQCLGRGEWAKTVGASTAPEGTVAVTTLVYMGTTSTGQGYFDDVVLGRLIPVDRSDEAARCSVEARTEGEDLLLTWRAPAGKQVEAHLPLMVRGSRVELADGERVALLDEDIVIDAEGLGDHFTHADLRVEVSEGASLLWPARHHNPYKRDGSSSLSHAKLVLVMPFEDTDEHTVRLSAAEREPFDGLEFDARDLPVEHSEGTYTKRLDGLGSQLLGGADVGDWLRFTLPEIEPGRYELLGDFVLADVYGIAEVRFDGEVIGEPFDAYWPAIDSWGTVQSFGEVEIDDGPHTVEIHIIGRHPDATNQIFSVKRWLLRPLE